VLSCDLLDCRSELAHLIAILLIGRGDMQRHQRAPRVDRDLHFAATASLSSIIVCSVAAFGAGL